MGFRRSRTRKFKKKEIIQFFNDVFTPEFTQYLSDSWMTLKPLTKRDIKQYKKDIKRAKAEYKKMKKNKKRYSRDQIADARDEIDLLKYRMKTHKREQVKRIEDVTGYLNMLATRHVGVNDKEYPVFTNALINAVQDFKGPQYRQDIENIQAIVIKGMIKKRKKEERAARGGGGWFWYGSRRFSNRRARRYGKRNYRRFSRTY